jgi:hypothetical protein
MRRKFKLFFIITVVFGLTLLGARLALLSLIEEKLESLVEFYKEADTKSELIADQRGDGSERLIKSLPVEIRKEAEELRRYLKIYCGFQSRLYIYISKKDNNGVVIKIETSPQWKDSFFFYYHADWLFSNNEALLSSLTKSGKYSSLFGKILKAKKLEIE